MIVLETGDHCCQWSHRLFDRLAGNPFFQDILGLRHQTAIVRGAAEGWRGKVYKRQSKAWVEKFVIYMDRECREFRVRAVG